jgi:hypothetical protein
MQVRPAGHAVVAQSGAQYWSPANWAQSEPAAQSEFWRHRGHAAAAPPTPAVVLVLVLPPALVPVLLLVVVLPPVLVPVPMFVLPPALVPERPPVPSPAPTPSGLPLLLVPQAAKPTAAAVAIQRARKFFIAMTFTECLISSSVPSKPQSTEEAALRLTTLGVDTPLSEWPEAWVFCPDSPDGSS